jgi:23S rRNA pseudouridine2604 synthase
MCEHFGYHVRSLRRVRIMNVTLDVPLGRWRYLSDREVKEIQKMVDRSSKVDQ